ncbi:predicted protein [Phaeodactylum tricornutum CCAP 1055/1]|jgi:8-oxo-dGTP diphosphatase|uniref:Nudix hydrolase domain-containing protein n=1 Tax=Phaeodactylum tricornutum (strain CCAP 1055/1) TaxID=556484 RepID=B7FS99_PHATC|nr:predicted protein [Phaeodactylum tricornutum CCAP 1055/1]EEC50442.1 predicted protein [Phaeodactylum tricornutum CCAP 1055/1]|eukprot:XP_002177628.1 predicted protein [Phaeodactylum tricornutum CCAP 1055/1]
MIRSSSSTFRAGRWGRFVQKRLLAISLAGNAVCLLAALFFSGRQCSNLHWQNLHAVDVEWNGGHPASGKTGTCYCNPEKYCLCTPSLAVDFVLASGEEHLWVVRRKDTNQLATPGGFVEVGETVEATVLRELKEETGLVNIGKLELLGIYSDPRRDRRRHTVSAVFIVHLDGTEHPHAADDVKDIQRIHLKDIEKHEFFADHKTILLDYRRFVEHGHCASLIPSTGDFATDIVRSVC